MTTTPTKEMAEAALEYATPHPKNDAAISLNAVKLREATDIIRARLAYLEREVARKDEALHKIMQTDHAELNVCNYDQVDVERLNPAAIEMYHATKASLSPQPEKEKPE